MSPEIRGRLVLALICGMALTAAALAADPGTEGFNTNCAMCHQTTGQGLPGQFPRIAGRVNAIASTAKGRQYLGTLVLYGMAGQIVVDGTPIIGLMPAFAGTLDDATLAGILNHVLQLDNKKKIPAFTPAEIGGLRRPEPLSPTAVHELRSELQLPEASRP